jgi:ElaB/YqjD/DUF883 family membrane-anchored ribosome-binding protein
VAALVKKRLKRIKERKRRTEMDTHQVTGSVKEMEGAAEKGYGKLKDRVSAVLNDLTDRSSEQFQSGWNDTVALVRQYPAQSVGIALLLGAAFGAWLSSRD